MSDWCILRTKGSSTLRLARSLNDSGIEAWTPTELRVKRDPKTRARSETIIAVMPTWVFARERFLPDLAAEAKLPKSLHPDFSVFRYLDRFPIVRDRELNALRIIERKAALKAAPVVFPVGHSIRIPDGPFQGLTGEVVELGNGEYTLLAFPGFAIPVKFATWTLQAAA